MQAAADGIAGWGSGKELTLFDEALVEGLNEVLLEVALEGLVLLNHAGLGLARRLVLFLHHTKL